MHVFQLVSMIKVQLVDKIKQSTYLCVILKHKNYQLILFYLISNSGHSSNGAQLGDHVW